MLQRIAARLSSKARNYHIRSSYFRKSLVIVLLITCLPTTFIGISLYFIGVNRVETEVNKTHQLLLNQVTQQLDEELSRMEVSLSQWSFNPMFGDKLKTMDFPDNYVFTRELLQTLFVMQQTNPLIDEVYLYIDSNATMISSTRGVNVIPESEQAFHREFGKLVDGNKTMFWTRSLPLPGSQPDNPSVQTDFKYSLVHKLPRDSDDRYGAIIVRLNTSKLSSYFRDFADESISMLLDNQGDRLLTGDQALDKHALVTNQLRTDVMEHWSKQAQGTFLAAYPNTKYSVSYHTFSRLGTEWIFSTASDISKVSEPVVVMSRLILWISGIGYATAIVLSWLASHRLYQPISRLTGAIFKGGTSRGLKDGDELKLIEKEWNNLSRESRILQTRVEEQLPTLRESFILQLVQGRLSYMVEEELRTKIAYYGWETQDKQYTVLVAQLTGLSNTDGKFKEEDEQLVTFAAANIIDELTRLRLSQSYVINLQDLSVGIMIGLPSDLSSSAVKKELTQLSEDIISTLNHILKLQVTVCMGQISTELGRIPHLFEEASHTLRFRKLMETNQVIDMDTVLVTGDYTFRYPFEMEKELIHAIRLGQEEEALLRSADFVKELEKSVTVELSVQQAMSQLIGNLNNALLQAGFQVYSFHEGRDLYEELRQLRQTDEILKWLTTMIVTPYVREMNQTYHSQMTRTVERVIHVIEEKYMTDLSLEECADLLGVNASSLSKAFKQIKGMNYVDYVTQVRIEVSKKLLLETTLKINEIAEKVGYQHSWYNRVFKKFEGVTPSQFRENQL
ncbi:AraC family transcriptional regulator [Paenibacillus oryzisoli]|uniref:helix-turn-helix transcriptional regulator n=1 Tax=Paenibacillus oryzisoli TaxID=1850517 RepID=UPI003D2D24FC